MDVATHGSVGEAGDGNVDDERRLVDDAGAAVVARPGVHTHGVCATSDERACRVDDPATVVEADRERHVFRVVNYRERRHRQSHVLLIVRHQPDQILTTHTHTP